MTASRSATRRQLQAPSSQTKRCKLALAGASTAQYVSLTPRDGYHRDLWMDLKSSRRALRRRRRGARRRARGHIAAIIEKKGTSGAILMASCAGDARSNAPVARSRPERCEATVKGLERARAKVEDDYVWSTLCARAEFLRRRRSSVRWRSGRRRSCQLVRAKDKFNHPRDGYRDRSERRALRRRREAHVGELLHSRDHREEGGGARELRHHAYPEGGSIYSSAAQ